MHQLVYNMSVSTTPKTRTSPKAQSDRILAIMIKKNPEQMRKLVLKLAKKNNPRLLSQMHVEDLFKKHIEFDSRTQLLRALKGSMKAGTLNTILPGLSSRKGWS